MNNLKKVIWIMLLCVVVLSTLLALLFGHQVSRAQPSVADIRQAMRALGFKTDLTDFNYTPDAAARARLSALMTLDNGPQLDSDWDQLNLLPVVSNATATVLWKRDSLIIRTNSLHWSDLHAVLDTNHWLLDAACDAAMAGSIRFGADASRGPNMFGFQSRYLQNFSQMFELRSILELHEGNLAGAWTNLLAATRLVTAYVPEPTGWSQCAQCEMAGAVFADAWQVLQKENWPEEKLAALQQEWESADFFTNLIESAAIDYKNDLLACQGLRLQPLMAGASLSTLVGQTLTEPADVWPRPDDPSTPHPF